MFTFDIIQCGLFVLALMVAGELVSQRLKAIVPAILASALLYLLLLWTGVLPNTLIKDSGLTHLTTIAMMFVIIGMGASTKPKELMTNWRVVALAAISYVGQTILMIVAIAFFFDRNIAIGGLPGGAAVALIVQERALTLGYNHIVLLSVLILSVQGLIACPLVSLMLRKEVKQIQQLKPTFHHQDEEIVNEHFEKNMRKESSYWSLLRFFLVAWLASRIEMITGISKYVFCLVLGVILAKLKFLRRDEMDRTQSRGFITLMMMTMVLDGFSKATPDMFIELLIPLLSIFAIEVISIFLISLVVGKLFGFSRYMSFAICLNVMIGFPLNLMLAQEIIEFLSTDQNEKEMLNQQIATKMVIAGFTSVTFLSTITAGLLVGLMK